MGDKDRDLIAALARELGPYTDLGDKVGSRRRVYTLPDGSSDWQRLREVIGRDPTPEDYQLLVDDRTSLKNKPT